MRLKAHRPLTIWGKSLLAVVECDTKSQSRPGTVLGPMTTMPVVIHDISGEVDKYNLDTHGFQFVKHESKEKDFFDVEKIEAEYYPETEELVKKVTGATRTFVFNHAIRRQPVEAADGSVPGRGPTYNAHIDQSYADAPNRVRRYFPEEAEELIKKRYQIINVSLEKYTTIFKFNKRKRLLTVTTTGMAPY